MARRLVPATLPNNPLTDVLPNKVRKYVYALAFLALLVYSAFQAADGDLFEALGGFLTAFVPLMAASNTPPPVL